MARPRRNRKGQFSSRGRFTTRGGRLVHRPQRRARKEGVLGWAELVALGRSPDAALSEPKVKITRSEINRVLGAGTFRKADRAYEEHRGGGRAMFVLLPGLGWVPARVYSREDRVKLARFANYIDSYTIARQFDGPAEMRRALRKIRELGAIDTSLGRIAFVSDPSDLAELDRANLLRGAIERLYLR